MESGWTLYKQGLTVAGSELTDNHSLGHYNDIFEDVKSERAVAQYGLDRDIYITKLPRFVVEIFTPEQSHLNRPEQDNPTIKNVTYSWGRYDEPSESEKLVLIQHQLRQEMK